jgi:hypothetical protein
MLKKERIELQYIAADGTVIDLTYGGLAYWSGAVGLGMSPIKRLNEQGPNQNGVTDLGFRLDQRSVGLSFILTGSSPEMVEAKQDKLYDLFKPRNQSYSLRLKRVKEGIVRQIDCHTLQGPDFSSDQETEGNCGPIFRAAIQVYAPNPVFYDPNLLTQSFSLSGGGGAWTIPWAIPWAIGSATLDQSVNIVYDGQWEEFPIITIQGPITDAQITNQASGDILSFVGATISTGETYTIDLRPGRKSVIDALGVNQIAKLTDGSDLATWSLLPSPDVTGGVNSIRVQGSGVSTVTQIYIQYYRRYIGGR